MKGVQLNLPFVLRTFLPSVGLSQRGNKCEESLESPHETNSRSDTRNVLKRNKTDAVTSGQKASQDLGGLWFWGTSEKKRSAKEEEEGGTSGNGLSPGADSLLTSTPRR